MRRDGNLPDLVMLAVICGLIGAISPPQSRLDAILLIVLGVVGMVRAVMLVPTIFRNK